MSLLENPALFYIVVFLCYINLMADVALGYYVFIVVFILLIILLSFFISNKTVALLISLIVTNIMIMKYDKLTLLKQ